MAKSVLVLTGSPRKGGNSDLLADAFVKGARKNGNRVTVFEAGQKKIYGCIACDSCWSTGNACSFEDDFRELAPLLEETDIIVFVTPLYWYSMSSQIKAAIDKLYAYAMGNCKKTLPIKEGMLISCGERKEKEVFQGLITTYHEVMNDRKWIDKGILIVPDVFAKGDVLNTEWLKEAEKMGSSI